jgi:hypothetical protein
MEFRQTLILNPRFNFLSFFDEALFTDCEIHVYEPGWSSDFRTIRSHRAILATSSAFFENAFTSGMQEARTGIVEVKDVSYNPMLQLVRFLYCGSLQFTDDIAMQIYALARDFSIPPLISLLEDYFEKCSTTLILRYVAQCFDFELEKELRAIVPCIAKKYNEISIQNFSTALDVVTFLDVQRLVKGRTEVEKFEDFRRFMGAWKPSEEEKIAIGEAFKGAPPGVQAALRKIGGAWLPSGFSFQKQ